MFAAPANPITAKQLGAYYTSPLVAEFLTAWAVRSADDRVVDPSFGGGVFLRAAAERVRNLGGDPGASIFGIEFDKETFSLTAPGAEAQGISRANLRQGDFFRVAPNFQLPFDAVVGNPPFIRYQQFGGVGRESATALMRAHGVRMSELASSWAPFVVGAASLLHEGGRLAMVVPMELCHASYGLTVLGFLSRSFRTVQFLSFARRLFPQLNQDTLLLLADGRGAGIAEMRWRHLRDADALSTLIPAGPTIPHARKLDVSAITEGRQRLIEQFLPARARKLYCELRRDDAVRPLGAVADVGIGYVTGANAFFHLTAADLIRWPIPASFLRQTVCRGRAFAGIRFTAGDWEAAYATGDAAQLLALPRHAPLPTVVKQYIAFGESQRIHLGYKCRSREPWYHVPHVYRSDAFLTYMSGTAPQLVANDADAAAPNTLHLVRLWPLAGLTPHQLAVTWQSSLTQLSAEIEGHAMGGGLLKLEPTEAERVLVARLANTTPNDPLDAMDQLMRHGRPGTVQSTVDRMVLRDRVGLSERDCRILRDAIDVLRARRLSRRG